nr:hypothetical protein [Candidatus Sigynarchaeota archaeon]
MIGSSKISKSMIIAVSFLAMLTLVNVVAVTVAGDGPPTPAQVFIDRDTQIGHNFTENYWDINVYNNSYWEVQDPAMGIDNMTTWLNNTWNIKWISEGNFEMGMFAFVNKTGDANANDRFFTPAQMWWMHYYYSGHEMLIANMLSAWFGFKDANQNHEYDEALDEEINPFFYMTQDIPSVHAVFDPLGLAIVPNVTVTPLHRSDVPVGQITYTWAYNYSDVCFWLPHVNQKSGAAANLAVFDWGFNYSDPGTYLDGSFGFGMQEFIYYEYTLVLNTATQKATLYNDFIAGNLTQLFLRDNQTAPWLLTPPSSPNYMPRDWIMCTGSHAFIMAGIDDPLDMHDTSGDAITANITNNGITTVAAQVEGTNVFNYEFSQKPNYTQYDVNDPTNHTESPVLYASLGIEHNHDFLNVVSGMTQLIGPFGALVVSYAINQTNHFGSGINFQDAWDHFDPENTSAFFITAYPEFGRYQGGRLEHDPVFSAYFTPGNDWGRLLALPGYDVFLILAGAVSGIVIVALARRKRHAIS